MLSAVIVLTAYKIKKPSLDKVLKAALLFSVVSEFVKVFSMTKIVPSSGGDMYYPYLELHQLPFHFCSVQIYFIAYVCFAKNHQNRETILAFMYPTCTCGAIAAIVLPSIFSNSIPVEKAFTHPLAYQFFLYHTMLIVIGVIIVMSHEVKWKIRHFRDTVIIASLMTFGSMYLNSMLASPAYVDGKLVSVDFATNYFYTYANPIGLKLTEKWQWLIYLLILTATSITVIFIMYVPLLYSVRKREDTER